MADNGILGWATQVFGGSVGTDEGIVVNGAWARFALAISSISAAGRVTWAKGMTLTPVPVSATTLTLAPDTHDNRPVVINSASGCTITLPAATGTGSCYKIYVGTTLTSGSFVVQVANGTDYMRGQAWTIGSANAGFLTANSGTVATESDTITFNRSTTGLGTQGDYIECTDEATNLWAVEADYASSGTAATPFSAAV